MELEQGSNLTLPLFIFDEMLSSRDIETPDLLVHIDLNEELLTQLCQNPKENSSITINLTEYRLEAISPDYVQCIKLSHQAQLTLTSGPVLSAAMTLDEEGSTFVSPQIDMMPTFDLGDEVEQ